MAATSDTPWSATRRALANPIILDCVIEWIIADRKGRWSESTESVETKDSPLRDEKPRCRTYNRWGVLVRCAQVNRVWFYQVVPFIWHGSVKYTRWAPAHLTAIFDHIPRERRQYYADMVKIATVRTVAEDDHSDVVLEGLSFPKLKSLYVMVYGTKIPLVPNHEIINLAIHPWCDFCAEACCVAGANQEFMERLLDQVVKLFPNVQKLEFSSYALVATGTMERLRGKLPRLETLIDSQIDESDCDFYKVDTPVCSDRDLAPRCRNAPDLHDDESPLEDQAE